MRPRNRVRYVVTLGANWRQYTDPIPGVQFLGTVQRGMHIGALGQLADGSYVCAERGRTEPLIARKVVAAMAEGP